MAFGRTVRLFLVDGTSTGLITAEIHNWTGHILVAPRDRIQEAFGRKEATKTGIYFLVGENDGIRKVYVGEADIIADRIRAHARDDDKEFWEHVCFVTSKDSNLTKAHVRFLESRIVSMARAAGRAAVVNRTEPATGYLAESDIADMEYFLSQLEILLPSLGYDFLRPPISAGRLVLTQNDSAIGSGSQNGGLELFLRHEGAVDARAMEIDGETVVLKGSRGSDKQHTSNSYASLRSALIEAGKLKQVMGEYTEFVEDIPFTSPSAAAAVLNNRNSAGPREWRVVKTGQTLNDWRADQISAAYQALKI